jgi:hypothetical protein
VHARAAAWPSSSDAFVPLPALIVLIAAAKVGPLGLIAAAKVGPLGLIAAAKVGPLGPMAQASAPPSAGGIAIGVEIAIAATVPEAAAAVREDLRELLARRGVTARYRETPSIDRNEVLRPASEAPCALACIWVDLAVAKPGRAIVYISATAAQQVVIRSVPLPGGVDEVAREEVSHIVASSVEALQAGRPLPVTDSQTSVVVVARPEPAQLAPPAPPSAGTFVVAGLGAGGSREAAGQIALPTVSLSVLVGPEHRRMSPALWLQGDGFASEATGDPVALRFRGADLAALAAIGTPSAARAVARLGVGPGVELRETTPVLMGSGITMPGAVQLDSSRLDPALFLRAAARFEFRFFERLGVFVAASCDVRVVSRRYMIERQGMSQAMFEPDRLRPGVMIGVDALLAGEGAR